MRVIIGERFRMIPVCRMGRTVFFDEAASTWATSGAAEIEDASVARPRSRHAVKRSRKA